MALGNSLTSCPPLDYYLINAGTTVLATSTTVPIVFYTTPTGNTKCFMSYTVSDFTVTTASGFAAGGVSLIQAGATYPVGTVKLAWFP
jgi:hypothetical protein